MTILLKTNFRFTSVPVKLKMIFFTEIEQKILKFVWSHKKYQIEKANLRKKNKAEGIRLPEFRPCDNQRSMVLA